jgi:hypothetical protein
VVAEFTEHEGDVMTFEVFVVELEGCEVVSQINEHFESSHFEVYFFDALICLFLFRLKIGEIVVEKLTFIFWQFLYNEFNGDGGGLVLGYLWEGLWLWVDDGLVLQVLAEGVGADELLPIDVFEGHRAVRQLPTESGFSFHEEGVVEEVLPSCAFILIEYYQFLEEGFS